MEIGLSRIEIIALALNTGISFPDLWVGLIMIGSRYYADIMLEAHGLVRHVESTMLHRHRILRHPGSEHAME